MGVQGRGPSGPILPPLGGSGTAPTVTRPKPTNQNCRGCGAFLVRLVCPYCGRRADPAVDLITPDPHDDPKRTIRPRTIYV